MNIEMCKCNVQHHLCTMETGIKLQLGLCLLKPRSSARLRRSEGLGEGLRAAGAGKRRLRMGLDTPLPRHTTESATLPVDCLLGSCSMFLIVVADCAQLQFL